MAALLIAAALLAFITLCLWKRLAVRTSQNMTFSFWITCCVVGSNTLCATNYPAAGLFVMLLVLWFFAVFAVIGSWATATASFFIMHSADRTDLEIINQFWLYHLIQPQWFG